MRTLRWLSVMLALPAFFALARPAAAQCVPPDCNDGVPCTSDYCDGYFCYNDPDDSLCGDGNECTMDVCDGSGCDHSPLDGPACTGGTCQNGLCVSAAPGFSGPQLMLLMALFLLTGSLVLGLMRYRSAGARIP